ncbi:MAG: dienelactone hydrolase family protein [Moraxellaceae bacterium]|nr:dienelactone hydrolase family protein [Moraxellaceae bacterium]
MNHRADFDSLLPPITFDRRSFIASMVAGGFALATHPVVAQTTITTDSEGLDAGIVEIDSDGFKLPAYFARPKTGENFPVVLVIQEIFGVHAYIQDVCRRLAKLGYLAVAPALHARQGDATQMTNVPQILSEIVSKVSDAQVMRDLDHTLAWAGKNKGNTQRAAITGFCWGGRTTWLYAAHNPNLKAGVAWYGNFMSSSAPNQPKRALDVLPELKVPVLGLYGEADSGIPMKDVEAARAALKAAGNTKSEIITYKEAPHAFHADYRPSYRKEAADDGWKRMQAWFKANGV